MVLRIKYSWLSLVFLLLTAFGSFRALAQDLSLLGIAHIAFHVSNIDSARAFFQRLGFEQAFAFSNDGKVTQAFIKVNDDQFIELYPASMEDPSTGFFHVCFQVSDAEALNLAYRKRGLAPSTVFKAGAGNLLFSLIGPEKQNIEYTQYLPGSLHFNDHGKHLGGDRIATSILATSVAMKDVSSAEAYYSKSLAFTPVVPRSFLLPGPSKQLITIKQAGQSNIPDLIFLVPNLSEAARELKDRGFTPTVSKEVVTISGPDGILVGFATNPK